MVRNGIARFFCLMIGLAIKVFEINDQLVPPNFLVLSFEDVEKSPDCDPPKKNSRAGS